MKKIIFGVILLGSTHVFSQSSAPVGNGWTAAKFLGFDATNGLNPLYTRTNNINRIRLNGNQTQTIDGLTGNNLNGYMGLGSFFNGGVNYWTNNSPFSQLHLVGRNGNFIQDNGYRQWMQGGISFTDNNDFSYIGIRQVGNTLDATEMVFNLSDNSEADDFVFRFSGGQDFTTVENDFLTQNDLDGRHIARFTGDGFLGLGNTFGNQTVNPTLANRPRSLLHMSFQFRAGTANNPFGFQQITYRRANGALADIIGQGEQATDGLRLGINNQIFGTGVNQHLNGYLRWQEASSFIIQTEEDNIANIDANERIRVTSIGAIERNYPGAAYFGLNNLDNTTRVSISELGSNPVTRPLSLVHLGYDLGAALFGFSNPQGYRKWMDLGTLTSTGQDHVWIGLKPKDSLVTNLGLNQDRTDGVFSWGSDRVNIPDSSWVDNMRFIFTGHTFDAPAEASPSRTYNGLEMMRMYPAKVYQHYLYDTTGVKIDSVQSYGRVGIGDFTIQGVDQMPTHKLDVVGNARLRYLPDSTFIADSSVFKYVMVDTLGVLRWTSSAPFGTYCEDTVGAKLLYDTKMVLNNHNLYFTNHKDSMTLNDNRLGVGYDCGTFLPAKLSVLESHDTLVGINTTAILGKNIDTSKTVSITFTGVEGSAIGFNAAGKSTNRGGYFTASNSLSTIGVQALIDTSSLNTSSAIGGLFTVRAVVNAQSYGVAGSAVGAAPRNIGVFGFSQNGTSANTGGQFNAITASGFQNIGVTGLAASNATRNIGGFFQANHTSTSTNIGVMGRTTTAPIATYPFAVSIGVYGASAFEPLVPIPSFAGYFDGNVFINGPVTGTSFNVTPSDAQFKTNVDSLENANELLMQLKPKTFFFDTLNNFGLNFSSEKQYGLIAQEVEPIMPELISSNTKPAVVDSMGNIVTQSINYKTLNYNAFISILIKGNQELQTKMDSVDLVNDSLINQVSDLNSRLTNLENCLSALLPTLCQMNQSVIQNNSAAQQEEVRAQLAVRLSNKDAIILDQNVPNPFAEQTVINFSIPATVKKAQIHFYNQEGRIIQSMDITERGLGSVTVFGSDLSSGVYTYTLIADGQIVATKKMMKQ